MDRCHSITAVAALLAISLLGAPRETTAQTGPEIAIDQRTFGTTSSVVYNIGASAFTGSRGADNAAVQSSTDKSAWCTSSCTLAAPVILPAGALVSRVELAACDTATAGDVRGALRRQPGLTGDDNPEIRLVFIETGMAATPGCGLFAADLAPPETIDNLNNNYFVNTTLNGGTADTRLRAIRLHYTLQVSPAPATATFDDVSTGHPFFAFIEALSAAGITAGCSASPPLYCPDAPLTRGQMAVFLSRALGLHWAP